MAPSADDGTRVDRLFTTELGRRGVRFTATGDLAYDVLLADGTERSVWIDNLVRIVARGHDEAAIRRFVDNVLAAPVDPGDVGDPGGIRWQAEPSSLELDDTLVDSVSPGIWSAPWCVSTRRRRASDT